jgi:pimeloyl-ACP methyl ester carboxylesterase
VPVPARAQQAPAIAPFSYRAPDAALSDLRRRLDAVRWPAPEVGERWSEGVPFEKLKGLVDYWRGPYDWRRAEAKLAHWPQFRTDIDGLGIHFIHVRSQERGALPIILTHGWPSTVQLFREIIAPLTEPQAHGGGGPDAFDVIIPSLPGFGFSDKPREAGWNAERIARAWVVLMRRLGYERYVAQGGDWGTYVTTAIAQQRPPGLLAIHLNFPQTTPNVLPQKLTPDEQRAVEAMRAFKTKGSGYAQMQATRPQTLAYALADSPVGQAAWIYDIFNGGTGNLGNPEAALTPDQMLDEITLYWLTNTAGSSARVYLEQAKLLGTRNNPGVVDLPVAVSTFPNDLPAAQSWAKAVYPNLYYWRDLDRGGHFAPLEVPELFSEELRRSFRRFRAA